ncbi:MAG: hypothetical protein ACI4JC_01015 [Faecalibacterium sp.]
MTFSYGPNNDSRVDSLFERSKPLLLFLSGRPIHPPDFDAMIQNIPDGEDKLAWCLANISSFCPLDLTDFDRFLLYCGTAVEAAAEACNIELSDEKLNLYTCGLACRTFNKSKHPINADDKTAPLILEAVKVEADSDLDCLFMHHVANAAIEYMAQNMPAYTRLAIKAMAALLASKDGYDRIIAHIPAISILEDNNGKGNI